MNQTAISTRQIFFLLTMQLPMIGHFFLVRIFFDYAGKDTWIGGIIAYILGIWIFIAMANLNEKLYGETIIQRLINWLGPWIGRILAIPLIFYFFMLSVITLYMLVDFMVSVFFLETPRWAIALSFGLAVFYLVHQGIEVIARVSEWILILILFAGVAVSLSLTGEKDFTQLLPFLDNGIEPIIPVIILNLAVIGEMIVMLMINVRQGQKSISYLKIYLITMAANLIIFLGTATGPIAIFGEELTKKFAYPLDSTVRIVSLGFIERLDSFGLTLAVTGSFIRLGILHYSTSLAISQWLSIKNYRWINWILGVFTIIISLVMFDNYREFYDFLKKYYPYGAISSIAIIILWLIVTLKSKKKNI